MFTTKNIAACACCISARGLFGLILAAVLAGCSVLPAPPTRAVVFDFGPGLAQPQAVTAPASAASPSTGPASALPPVALAEVSTTGVPEGSTAVLYRLAYANAQQLRPYGQARWSQPPAQLVQQALRDQMGQRRAVLLGEEGIAQLLDNGRPPTVVRVQLEEFSQVFSAPDASNALVRLRASIGESTTGGEKLVAQRVFVVQRPATTADAVGGTRALADAAAQAAAELEQWLEQLGR
ncbi:ABC-type transport auxiliary lipoprotein family protein [Paracidovorax wautersii]|uniref:Cholesterol transport system auxiliary component n=1 Tax=Paracidovorax wautersii TaxID=1177982 RepID=A0ABU1IA49_9BURK|nr:ABC-type transport auxiliary lipoprotein family protein [Paracidovorax wautersii]MDR6213313.1 cholesterol transport system auxiliary component [Paracidovorax wautersii]